MEGGGTGSLLSDTLSKNLKQYKGFLSQSGFLIDSLEKEQSILDVFDTAASTHHNQFI
jgi:predicted deacylase